VLGRVNRKNSSHEVHIMLVSLLRRTVWWIVFLLAPVGLVAAQQIALPVEVIFIPKKIPLWTLELETTVYKPPGSGPFPLVVINHGKAPGAPGLQPRYTPGWAARYFVERGYVVFVPMRTGFSKSTGGYVGGGCNVESNGLIQAEDVAVTVAYAHTLSYVERTQTLIVGQSHGGWTTLARSLSQGIGQFCWRLATARLHRLGANFSKGCGQLCTRHQNTFAVAVR